jgi:hypothetical protein
VHRVVVDRTWHSVDRRWLVDQVVDEPGVEYRVWDAEGAPIAEVSGPGELRRLLDRLGVDSDGLQQVPTEDPWCE